MKAFLILAALLAQSDALRFDVVSIHENTQGFANETGMSLKNGSLEVHNMPLKSLMTSAYGVHELLIFGLPAWAETVHYDVRAKVTDGDPAVLARLTREQHLEIHRSTYAGTSTMPGLASFLEEIAGRSVIDKTGLTAAYELHLQWDPELSGTDTLPSLFTALQDQLGLKLQPGKGPAKTLAVDHIDPLSDN